jgi:hypothetical protein
MIFLRFGSLLVEFHVTKVVGFPSIFVAASRFLFAGLVTQTHGISRSGSRATRAGAQASSLLG